MAILESVLSVYIESVAKLLRRLRVEVGLGGVSISIADETQHSVDERIAMIDAARANLLNGVRAIDELRAEAERNKRDAEQALQQLSAIKQDKADLERQREALKTVIQSDVNAFRTVAGVPSAATVRRERFIGFVSGVIASVVASGIVWGIAKLIAHLSP